MNVLIDRNVVPNPAAMPLRQYCSKQGGERAMPRVATLDLFLLESQGLQNPYDHCNTGERKTHVNTHIHMIDMTFSTPCGPPGLLWAGPLWAPWALVGPLGPLRARPLWDPWALVGPPGPSWARRIHIYDMYMYICVSYRFMI